MSGIAPLKDDLIVLLSYMIDVSNELKSVNVMQSGPVKRKVYMEEEWKDGVFDV